MIFYLQTTSFFYLHDSFLWSPCASLVRFSIFIFLGKGLGWRPTVRLARSSGLRGSTIQRALLVQDDWPKLAMRLKPFLRHRADATQCSPIVQCNSPVPPSLRPSHRRRPPEKLESHARLVSVLCSPCACLLLLPALCCPRVLPLCWCAVVAGLVLPSCASLVLDCCCCLPCLSLVLPLCLFAVVAALVLPLCLFSLVEFLSFRKGWRRCEWLLFIRSATCNAGHVRTVFICRR
jgi:hypothetical protein